MKSIRLLPIGMALLAGILGLILNGAPQVSEEEHFPSALLGQFLVFCFWLHSLISWGEWIRRAISWEVAGASGRLASRIALGSLFYYSFSLSIGLMLPQWPYARYWAFAVAFVGIVGGQLGAVLEESKEKRSVGYRLLFSVFVLAVGLHLLSGFKLHRHGDAFICYLTGPRIWFDAGSFKPYLESPIQFYASAWEALFQWGNYFLAGAPGEGLAAVQRFSQWITAAVGVGGLGLLVLALFREIQPRSLTVVAAIAAISVPTLRWMNSLAKNDVGVSFWAMASLYPLFVSLRKSPKKAALLGGALLGAAVIAKPSAVALAFPAAVLALIRLAISHGFRRSLIALGFLVLGGVSGALPVLLRNGVLTGNPLFPWLNSLFPSSVLGPTLQEAFGAMSRGRASLGLSDYLGYLKEITSQSPLIWASLLGLLPYIGSGVLRIPSRVRWLSAVAWGAVVLFCWKLRPSTELRYLGPALPLLVSTGVVSIGCVLLRLHERFRWKAFLPGAVGLLAVGMIASSGIPVFLLKKAFQGYFRPAQTDLLEHVGGRAKAWLKSNAGKGDLILSVGDNEIYHALDYRYVEIHYHSEIDRAFSERKSAEEMAGLMSELGARYFLHLHGSQSLISDRYIKILQPYLDQRPECRIYQDPEGDVYEVSCLAKDAGNSK